MFRFRRCKKPPGTNSASGGWLIAQDAIYEDLQPHSGYPGREDRLPLAYPEYFNQEAAHPLVMDRLNQDVQT